MGPKDGDPKTGTQRRGPKDGDPTGVEASERMEFVMPRRNRVSAAT